MKCIECGYDMILETRDFKDVYNRTEYTVQNLHGHYCDNCGESIHSREESQKIYEAIDAIKSKSSSSLIRKVRKQIGIDQRRAGEIFGGGPNGFSKYENGKTKAPNSMVILFKLIEKHPELVKDISGLDSNKITTLEHSHRI